MLNPTDTSDGMQLRIYVDTFSENMLRKNKTGEAKLEGLKRSTSAANITIFFVCAEGLLLLSCARRFCLYIRYSKLSKNAISPTGMRTKFAVYAFQTMADKVYHAFCKNYNSKYKKAKGVVIN